MKNTNFIHQAKLARIPQKEINDRIRIVAKEEGVKIFETSVPNSILIEGSEEAKKKFFDRVNQG